jgi:hypothetical protein
MLAEGRKNIPEAIANYKQAVARLESIRNGLSNEDHRRTLMDDTSVQDLYGRLLRLAHVAARKRRGVEVPRKR